MALKFSISSPTDGPKKRRSRVGVLKPDTIKEVALSIVLYRLLLLLQALVLLSELFILLGKVRLLFLKKLKGVLKVTLCPLNLILQLGLTPLGLLDQLLLTLRPSNELPSCFLELLTKLSLLRLTPFSF
ncbi:hypothetical protein ACOSQ3_022801 [Xanthoceras sorbifolium]